MPLPRLWCCATFHLPLSLAKKWRWSAARVPARAHWRCSCWGFTPRPRARFSTTVFPLHHLNYRALRSQFGVVLQEPFLFSGSIRQNIAFSNPNLRLDQVVEAARLAAIDEEIATMPMGYETRISERGSGLSGGQRQRISLARALVHRPAMLLLDEATSHLDVVTELRVEHNLNQLACTRVVIAHRMSSVRNAAQIVVLEDGKVPSAAGIMSCFPRTGAMLHSSIIRLDLSQTTRRD